MKELTPPLFVAGAIENTASLHYDNRLKCILTILQRQEGERRMDFMAPLKQ